MKVAALVSENGLGHIRRTVGILSRLVARGRITQVDLVCEAWQIDRLRGWRALDGLMAWGLRLHHGFMAPGPRWPLPDDSWERLRGWEARAWTIATVRDADLVLSDNLVGVLAVRPDTVMLGSFLWSEVLDTPAPSPRVREFVARDRALLAEHRPPMLCVDALAMPGVREHTTAIALPWMCDRVVDAAPEAGRVAVLGGASGAADRILRDVAVALSQAGLVVMACEAWNVGEPFAHGAEDFARCTAVVCRPGVGTLTDAVAASVPMVLVHEGGNREMTHNAEQVSALGMGLNLGPADARAVVEAVRDLLGGSEHRDDMSAMRGKLRAQSKDGLDRAADWLSDRSVGQAGA